MAKTPDFNTEGAKLRLKQITMYLKSLRLGCSMSQIAVRLEMSQSGISPYVAKLCEDKVIHIAQVVEATQQGCTPAIYKFGPPRVIERRRKPAYMNDPLLAAFFGRNK